LGEERGDRGWSERRWRRGRGRKRNRHLLLQKFLNVKRFE